MIERGAAGTIAAFPPPHTFFWAREVATNLGYNWYRKDSDASFSFGIRQAEKDPELPQYAGNFALYSARPGTWQRMAVYFYASAEPAAATLDPVLAFTHGDRFKPLPGYQVMNHHYHMDLGRRLLRRRQPRRRNSRPPRAQVARHQHRQPGRLGRIPDAGGRARRRTCSLAAARRLKRGAVERRRRDAKAVRAAAAAAATCSRSPPHRSKARDGIPTRRSW